MEGYKPQDFSFFHRSEKLVQQLEVICKYFIEMRDKYGMQSWFMNQF